MSAKMLGASSAILDPGENAKPSNTKEHGDNPKKSIKSFFQSCSSEPESSPECKDKTFISSFFRAKEKPLMKPSAVESSLKSHPEVESADAKIIKRNDTQEPQSKDDLGYNDSSIEVEHSHEVYPRSKSLAKSTSGKASDSSDPDNIIMKNSLSKKNRTKKWSLSWQVSKKSKSNSLEDLTSDSDLEKNFIGEGDVREKGCHERIEKKETKKNKPGNVHKKKKDQLKTKELNEQEKDNEKWDSNVTDLNTGRMGETSTFKGGSNAFDILMSKPKKHDIKHQSLIDTTPSNNVVAVSQSNKEESGVRTSVGKKNSTCPESSQTCKIIDDPDGNIDVPSEHPKSVSMSGTNAFDLLMQKKSESQSLMKTDSSKTDETSLCEESTMKSAKRKSGTFKLNICYSKKKPHLGSGEEGMEGSFDESAECGTEIEKPRSRNERNKPSKLKPHTESHSKQKAVSKMKRKKCETIAMGNASSDLDIGSDDLVNSVGVVKQLKSGKRKGKSSSGSQSREDSESKSRKHKIKRTRIKEKSKETRMKSSDGNPEEKAPQESVYISDSSNLSFQEISDLESTGENVIKKNPKKKKKTARQSLVTKSSDSDDFEKLPGRLGLRKRFIDRCGSVGDKQEEGGCEEYKGRRPEKSTTSVDLKGRREVKAIVPCQTAQKTKKEIQIAAPQKLAPIFMPRVKPPSSQKKDDKMADTPKERLENEPKILGSSTEEASKQTEGNKGDTVSSFASKPAEVIDLAAANKAFNSLFAGSKARKCQFPTSQAVVQMPAPWPRISHVQQIVDGDAFWSLDVPDVNRSLQDSNKREKLVSPRQDLHLGEFTLSCLDKDAQNNQQEKSVASQPFHPAVVKRILSDVSKHYPGVPLRRLYKRYKANEDGNRVDNKSIAQADYKKTSVKLVEKKESTKEEVKGFKKENEIDGTRLRGRQKRKISIESESEPFEKQQKRARKGDGKRPLVPVRAKEESKDTVGSRKKRMREDEAGHVGREKRRSTRLKEATEELCTEEMNKGTEKMGKLSKPKKRKTMKGKLELRTTEKTMVSGENNKDKQQHQVVPNSVTMVTAPSEDSGMSQDGTNRGDGSSCLPWCDRFKPTCSSEVMGNVSAVGRLRTWLEKWKIKREKTLRKELELQKRLLAKQRKLSKAQPSLSLEWFEEDSDDDFRLSDADTDDSDTEDSGLCNAMLVVGPKGVGKTAMVYACAKELGYKVFEVNCASKRSSRQILTQLEEATQSHLLVTNPSANTPHSSAFGGLFGSLGGEKCDTTSKIPVSAFFKPVDKQEKTDEKPPNRKGRKSKDCRKNEPGNKDDRKEKTIRSSTALGCGSNSNAGLSLKAASLILFEEVDVVFEDDKSFWSAVNSFMRNTKCPIIMTSTDPHVECDGRYEQLTLKSPSIHLLSAHLQLAALANHVMVSPADIMSLVSLYGGDIRRCLLALQFWVLSGGGVRTTYEEYCMRGRVGEEQEMDATAKTAFLNNQGTTGTSETQMTILDDPSEESMFLSLDDWKTLRQTRSRGRTQTTADGDLQNIDSEFESTKKTFAVGLDDTRSNSILIPQDAGDSQSLQVSQENSEGPMPDVHYGLTECTLGMMNCVGAAGAAKSWVTLLGCAVDGNHGDDKSSIHRSLSNLAAFCQYLGINIIRNNIKTLLPRLFVHPLDEQPQVHKGQLQEPGNVAVVGKYATAAIFSDRSLFDDGEDDSSSAQPETQLFVPDSTASIERAALPRGQSPVVNNEEDDVYVIGSEQSHDQDVSSSHEKTEVKQNDCTKLLNAKALEIFSHLAEDASFMDSYTQNPPCEPTQSESAVYGWWHAQSKPGINDDVITIREQRDWLMESRRAHVRGALEVASLECSFSRYHAMMKLAKAGLEEEIPQEGGVGRDLRGFLPVRETGDVVQLSELTYAQQSTLVSRTKLYRTATASLPLLTHCSHRAVCMDYLPALRSICRTEHLRETANTKRRFLHYLNSNAFPFNRSTLQSLADAYLAR